VDELSLMLRGFLIRLTALDGQLEDNRGASRPALPQDVMKMTDCHVGETTFAIIVETLDDLEPTTNNPADGVRIQAQCEYLN
jgi:mitotic spindle assembly checkpoint protein MAD2B